MVPPPPGLRLARLPLGLRLAQLRLVRRLARLPPGLRLARLPLGLRLARARQAPRHRRRLQESPRRPSPWSGVGRPADRPACESCACRGTPWFGSSLISASLYATCHSARHLVPTHTITDRLQPTF